jgi:hypothetical protein
MKVSLDLMRLAIHQTHDCEATRCIEVVEVAPNPGRIKNTVAVHVFEIEGHPTATRCYAWGVQKDTRTIVIPAVLHSIRAPTAARAIRSVRGTKRQ